MFAICYIGSTYSGGLNEDGVREGVGGRVGEGVERTHKALNCGVTLGCNSEEFIRVLGSAQLFSI